MSFSSEVKEELFNHVGKSRHCQIAEMAAIMAWESDNPLTDEKKYILFSWLCDTESLEGSSMQKMYEAVKMWDHENNMPILRDTVDGVLIQQSCCKRAYIRGAFLAAGSISDPNKSYHFEVVCRTLEQAEQLQEYGCQNRRAEKALCGVFEGRLSDCGYSQCHGSAYRVDEPGECQNFKGNEKFRKP